MIHKHLTGHEEVRITEEYDVEVAKKNSGHHIVKRIPKIPGTYWFKIYRYISYEKYVYCNDSELRCPYRNICNKRVPDPRNYTSRFYYFCTETAKDLRKEGKLEEDQLIIPEATIGFIIRYRILQIKKFISKILYRKKQIES